MGKKPIVPVTYENERISIKKQFPLLKKCVTSLLCGPRADLRSNPLTILDSFSSGRGPFVEFF